MTPNSQYPQDEKELFVTEFCDDCDKKRPESYDDWTLIFESEDEDGNPCEHFYCRCPDCQKKRTKEPPTFREALHQQLRGQKHKQSR